MSERIDTPFTHEHFAAWCEKMVGHGYWYGTCGYRATETLLKRKRSRYPEYYPRSMDAKFRRDIAAGEIVADCIGGCKGYAWTGGGEAILAAFSQPGAVSQKYQANGCPDKGADGMFEWAKKQGAGWGSIETLPDVPGLCLHKKGHVGYTVGGGMAFEWRGTRWGCVKTRVIDRPWTEWFALPFLDYGDARLPRPKRTLKRGSKGAEVKELQERLNQLGAALAVDGVFGKMTEAAVRKFQKDHGLKADGVCGVRTWTEIEKTPSSVTPAA